jgi:hypothetical protein
MKGFTRYLWPLPVVALFVGLYELKAMVEDRERELAQIRRAIADEKETVQILRAEWSYLNQPERLQRLAASLPELKPAAGRQLTTIARWPDRWGAAGQEAMRDDAPPLARGKMAR